MEVALARIVGNCPRIVCRGPAGCTKEGRSRIPPPQTPGPKLGTAAPAAYDRTYETQRTNRSPCQNIAEGAERLRSTVEKQCDIVVWDLAFERDLAEIEADYVLVFGGDGSILRAAHQMGYRQRPMLGVNLGKLGFLADVTPS
jgi:hypothetical protein